MTKRGRYSRWALLVLTVLFGLFGVGDVVIGPAFDPGIALGLTGLTHAELEAESAAGYRLLDFYTRSGGLHLIVIGVALTAVLLIPYRSGERWAWWLMWSLPAWTLGGLIMNASFGVAPGQAPPPPMVSAPILGFVAVVALLVDRPRFRVAAPEGQTAATPQVARS